MPPLTAAFVLVQPLWHGTSRVVLSLREYRVVRTTYPTDYLHILAGHGYLLKHKSVGAGLYEVWLERRQ